ncbi:MAG: flagellar protein FlaG [Sulfuricurvum sp.]|nr:flagellar protein FlaG [Sulfuricurvum sp.]MDP3022698.1 flagellar protein FlaG [Sulfuricurvum sp.]MDP3120900.1 flagellar protein FlaG [Sulfuricurvum sp.]
MEVLQSTAKLQQAQMGTAKAAATEVPAAQSVQQLQKAQINQDKVAEANTDAKTTKVSSKESMDALIEKLNKSLDPFSTSLRFGYDDSFYVSVIDTQRNAVLRRFPLEQAEQLLPKMQEVTGMLFDIKG